MIGVKNNGHSIEVIGCTELPKKHSEARPIGRNLNGCRIGFDLGGSDRKAAAVVDGEVKFSEEIEWDPYFEPDPDYHYQGIMNSLKRAAEHLPRVDAIGGSAAGCYSHNRVTWASLFRGVEPKLFDEKVRDMFLNIGREWGVPLEVLNDGRMGEIPHDRHQAALGLFETVCQRIRLFGRFGGSIAVNFNSSINAHIVRSLEGPAGQRHSLPRWGVVVTHLNINLYRTCFLSGSKRWATNKSFILSISEFLLVQI